jgi:EmrB/QacA subfamily drug resistance transporter
VEIADERLSTSPRRRGRPAQDRVVAVVYVSSLVMATMDAVIVNVALPTLARSLQVATTTIQWTVVAYLLALAVFIPASGWFGDRFGTKRTLLAAVAVFTVASALCALSTNIVELTAFRALQGAAGGMLTPVGSAMLFRAYPAERRVSIQPVLSLATLLSPASAPLIGGLILSRLSWHWIFLVNVPIGVAALGFGGWFLDEQREARPGRFDIVGFTTAGAGLACVLFALGDGPASGWGSPEILVTAVAGAALLAAFVVVERRSIYPILRIRLFEEVGFRQSTIVMVSSAAAFQGTLFLAPLYLQDGRGYSVLQSGFTTCTDAIGVMVSAQIVRRIYPIVGPRRLSVAGLTFLSAVLVALSLVGDHAGEWEIRVMIFAVGFGVGQSNLPVQISAFANVSTADMGDANAIFNMVRRASPAVSVSVLSTILAIASGHRLRPLASDFRPVFLACAVIGLIGAASALFIDDAAAASTMTRGTRRVVRSAERRRSNDS